VAAVLLPHYKSSKRFITFVHGMAGSKWNDCRKVTSKMYTIRATGLEAKTNNNNTISTRQLQVKKMKAIE
jgi:hypothetical protein